MFSSGSSSRVSAPGRKSMSGQGFSGKPQRIHPPEFAGLLRSGFLQEDVVRRIGHAAARILAVTGALQDAADGVDPLDRGDVGKLAGALVRVDLELQPG